jgi:hypothetical protein
MKITHHRLPTSVYYVFVAAVAANAIVTFIMLKYFL